ncbi:MAG: metallophosphoesterase [Lentisphaeria bacterium]|nr:metallophosphoesterase [Lentisphaeria bacterium]
MTRILLISDTHGNIDLINNLAVQCRVDLTVHAGDFGFYRYDSTKNLSTGEMYNLINHSPLPQAEKNKILPGNPEDYSKAIHQYQLLGNFEEYYSGKKQFICPVYAIWGNHEDAELVCELLQHPLPNLQFLTPENSVEIESVLLYGLGGNCVDKYLSYSGKNPIPFLHSQLQITLAQLQKLTQYLDTLSPLKRRIQITHVDPTYELLLQLLAWRNNANFTISGHMHAPEVINSYCSASQSSAILARQQELQRQYPLLDFSFLTPLKDFNSTIHLNLPMAATQVMIMEINGSDIHLHKPVLPAIN